MANQVSQPNNFRIVPNAVTLKIYRTSDVPIVYNLTGSVTEINIYEDLNTPFISGSMHIIDSAAIASLNFTGSESVVIRLWNNENYQIEKEFVIWQITNQTRPNENTMSYIVHFMEPLGFLNNFRYVSRAYSGNHSEILHNIYRDYLNEDLTYEEAYQSSKVVFPNVRPLEAAKWIMQNTTEQLGEPFFLYSSLKEGPQFRSLSSLYTSDPLPVQFGRFPAASEDFQQHARHILRHEPASNERIIDLARKGVFRADRYIIDPLTNEIRNVTYDYKDYFDRKVEQNRELYDGLSYDPSFPINGEEKLGSSNPIYVSSVNTSLAFGNQFTGIEEEETISDHLLNLNAEGDRFFLDKNSSHIVIPGWHMLAYEDNSSIGRIIDINIPKPSPSTVQNNSEAVIDQKYSGKFLITNVCHKFSFYQPAENYVASLTLKRTSSLDNSTTTGTISEEPL